MFPKDESLDIEKDLDILREINEAIKNCVSSNYDLKKTLISIGDLSNQISYNYNEKSIRRRYGPLLLKIYHLKVILSNDHIFSLISEEEWVNVRQCLPLLKEQINSILKEQESLEGRKINLENNNFQEKLLPITKFSTKYYKQLVLYRILIELDQMEPIDFREQIDRYYFARLFCIIGELFNEWLEDKTIKPEQNDMMSLLKDFIKFKDNIVHQYRVIKSGLENRNESINTIIDELKHHLTKIIVKEENTGLSWKIDLSYNCAEDFRKALDKLMSEFIDKSMGQTDSSTNISKVTQIQSNDKIYKKLNTCLFRFTELTSVDNQSRECKETYGRNLKKLPESKRRFSTKRYPPDLILEKNDETKQFCFNFEDQSNKSSNSIDSRNSADDVKRKFFSSMDNSKSPIDRI